MGKIIEYIDQNTSFTCFCTKKYSLDDTQNENIDYSYDRNKNVDSKGNFAETDTNRTESVDLRKLLNNNQLPPRYLAFS